MSYSINLLSLLQKSKSTNTDNIINLVCTGERSSIVAIKELLSDYEKSEIKLKTIHGIDCLMFDSKKLIDCSGLFNKLNNAEGAWNIYYMTYRSEYDYYIHPKFYICGDQDEIIFQTGIKLFKNLCYINWENCSFYSQKDINYNIEPWNIIKKAMAQTFIYKKSAALCLLRLAYADNTLGYDYFKSYNIVTEIYNYVPYFHKNFDDDFVIRQLKKHVDKFFCLGVDLATYWQERYYLQIIKKTKEIDDYISLHIKPATID